MLMYKIITGSSPDELQSNVMSFIREERGSRTKINIQFLGGMKKGFWGVSQTISYGLLERL